MRTVLRLAATFVALVVAYVAVTGAQVWWASRQDGARPAEAIVVLGAAQYDGRPSPVLRARLDHAADLFSQGLAPLVVVTGGRAPGDRVTEATAAADYLLERGVPEAALRREVSGQSSYESLAATSRFLRDEGIDDVLLVSDSFHAYRIAAIAEEVGLDAAVSPTPSSPISGGAYARQMLRETAAVALGRLVGYRRMRNLEEYMPRSA